MPVVSIDSDEYYFTTEPFELTNPLEKVIATLQKISIYTSVQEKFAVAVLYRTTDGTWYDLQNEALSSSKLALAFKRALDGLNEFVPST